MQLSFNPLKLSLALKTYRTDTLPVTELLSYRIIELLRPPQLSFRQVLYVQYSRFLNIVKYLARIIIKPLRPLKSLKIILEAPC